MSSERCGEPTKSGTPCEFPSGTNCPHHRKRGRPTKYTERIASEICRRIANGESLRNICRAEKFPAASTVVDWANQDRSGFSERYTRALHIRSHVWAEEILHISDDRWNDTYVDSDGEPQVDYEHIQRSRLRVDSRKWLLSKLLPEKFGKKTQIQHSGEIKGGVLRVPVVEDEDWERAARQLQKREEALSGNGDGPS